MLLQVARFHTRIASIPEVLIYYAGCEVGDSNFCPEYPVPYKEVSH